MIKNNIVSNDMMLLVPAMYWQNGLTLLYPFSCR